MELFCFLRRALNLTHLKLRGFGDNFQQHSLNAKFMSGLSTSRLLLLTPKAELGGAREGVAVARFQERDGFNPTNVLNLL
jgi:hypothetical protein